MFSSSWHVMSKPTLMDSDTNMQKCGHMRKWLKYICPPTPSHNFITLVKGGGGGVSTNSVNSNVLASAFFEGNLIMLRFVMLDLTRGEQIT